MPAWTVRTQTVRTLAAIGEQCAQDRPIHFLKVDVERHEEIVLRGMDFSRWRPWIILIETLWARDQTWETLVTGAGYQAILFDGINTYYLAEEHLALKPAFDIPPCNLDGFQLCKGHKFSHPVDETDRQLSAAQQRPEQA
ncbi:methyltransferase FkbM [Pseudomonas sp. CFII68]|nr:methyltransferase FkbM [Pseudomonas sp. CFII68]